LEEKEKGPIYGSDEKREGYWEKSNSTTTKTGKGQEKLLGGEKQEWRTRSEKRFRVPKQWGDIGNREGKLCELQGDRDHQKGL